MQKISHFNCQLFPATPFASRVEGKTERFRNCLRRSCVETIAAMAMSSVALTLLLFACDSFLTRLLTPNGSKMEADFMISECSMEVELLQSGIKEVQMGALYGCLGLLVISGGKR